MNLHRRNVYLLSTCQALLYTQAVTLVSVGSLIGFQLAETKALATLPAAMYVLGGAASTMPAAWWMQQVGSRDGFLSGAAIGGLGAMLAMAAVAYSSFSLFCLGMALLGVYNACGQYYRFAAADSVTPEQRPGAVSGVLLGGVIGGILGPELSKVTVDMQVPRFVATFASLVVLAVAAMIVIRMLALPADASGQTTAAPRRLGEIMTQPRFATGVVVGTLGFAVMNLLMTATPLAMSSCGHGYTASATAIQVHVVAMFAPSFFTGALIARFGEARIICVGIVAFLLSVAMGLSGTSVWHFTAALGLLGVGWNFTYIAGTTLITGTYTAAERGKAQGFSETVLVAGQAASAITSGAVLSAAGWQVLNLMAIPLIATIGVALAMFSWHRRDAQNFA